MKKWLFILLICAGPHIIFAQKDSVHKPYVAALFNPGLLLGGHIYFGIEYKPSKDVLLMVGASYGIHHNTQPADTIDNNGLHQGLNPPVVQFGTKGHNYTGYFSAMVAMDNHSTTYGGISIFYRQWILDNEVSYSQNPSNSDFNDIVLHPQIGNRGEISYYQQPVYVFHVTSNVFCFDINYLTDLLTNTKSHFVCQVYTGTGFRSKEFLVTQIGYYPEGVNTGKSSQPVSFVPVAGQQEKESTASYFDFKFGFSIGYRF